MRRFGKRCCRLRYKGADFAWAGLLMGVLRGGRVFDGCPVLFFLRSQGFLAAGDALSGCGGCDDDEEGGGQEECVEEELG